MKTRFRRSFLLLSLVSIGCGYRERGRFEAVSVESPHLPTVFASAPVTGRACFSSDAELNDDRVIDAAVSDALAKVPGTDALANAIIVDEGGCIRVEGRAVLIGPALIPLRRSASLR